MTAVVLHPWICRRTTGSEVEQTADTLKLQRRVSATTFIGALNSTTATSLERMPG
jgi:hypothetical protein